MAVSRAYGSSQDYWRAKVGEDIIDAEFKVVNDVKTRLIEDRSASDREDASDARQ
jgi:hypothetical protein